MKTVKQIISKSSTAKGISPSTARRHMTQQIVYKTIIGHKKGTADKPGKPLYKSITKHELVY